jgi:hypothetical protein
MTAIAPPSAGHRQAAPPAALAGLHGRLARDRAAEGTWVLPATAGVMALSAVLYLVNLTVSGFANVFYSGAAACRPPRSCCPRRSWASRRWAS